MMNGINFQSAEIFRRNNLADWKFSRIFVASNNLIVNLKFRKNEEKKGLFNCA